MNFQKTGNNEYDYVHVGSWVSGGDLNIFHPVQWPSSFDNSIPESVCSKPCVKGEVKVGYYCIYCIFEIIIFLFSTE